MTKAVTKVCNLLTIIILVCVVGIVGVLLIPRAMGYETFAVLSGSMEPYYHVGSVVFVDKSATPEEVEVGDPITFKKSDDLVATHRVVEIHEDTQEFVTKGDANEVIDAEPIAFSQLVGKAGVSVPMLGYISIYMKTKKGMFGIAAVFIVIILLQLIPEIVKPEDPDKEKKNKKKGEQEQ